LACDSSPHPSWRLGKTLARKPSFRPLEAGDLRFVWAAYKQTGMDALKIEPGLTPEDFTVAFEATVLNRYTGAWLLFAGAGKPAVEGGAAKAAAAKAADAKPVGMIFAFFSHPDPALAPFMIIGDIVWFPWASCRQRVEAAVNFFNEARKEVPMVEYARPADRRFFEMICRHGIMRRVGTSHNVFSGEPAVVFETRLP